jgi:hypothetical protein
MVSADYAAEIAAQLQQTQADLYASQADLTRVERERDEAAALNRQLAEQLDWQREVVAMLRKNEEVRAQVIRERNRERDLARAELASARQELAQLRAARRPFHDVPVPEADRPAMAWLDAHRRRPPQLRTTGHKSAPQTTTEED